MQEQELRNRLFEWIRGGMKEYDEPVIEGPISNRSLKQLIQLATIQPKTVVEDCLLLTGKFEYEFKIHSEKPTLKQTDLSAFIKELKAMLLRED